jgi:hypothetical protein
MQTNKDNQDVAREAGYQVGQKLTIFSISESMAHTQKAEVTITSLLETPEERLRYQRGPLDGYRHGAMKYRGGKRKEYYFDVRLNSSLVFNGWDLPLITDSEALKGSFSGNACFNLAKREPMSEHRLDTIFLRAYISEKALNPLTDQIKGACLCVRATEGLGCGVGEGGELLWPEIEIAHAVVQRMKQVA